MADFCTAALNDLTRFVQLRAGLRYDKNKYLVTPLAAPVPLPISRDDDIVTANLGVSYLLSRQISFGAAWDYSKRTSNAPTADYTRNKAAAFLKVTL
ncbi:hypothetical protein COO09_23940 [Rhizorhabdus dicambivorans]|uniref:TonB-dependent receptor-like beta-barrel domain-containing protein n=1 Tax=Rhizorhabdus dicambivorans TaxID=1850238 RepID=A0A2A4FPX1_9SPHN|nr:outer membrane beta-barrel protein [Rhizorhabdus dicambivorans]ATE66192.1 hypothetical protein CMV14_18770 [Rhizorhabdus dicambivorans]PCE39752.1 hypothetical protein COO09_23940 [Rhizorhabdus dicambivorans]